MSIRRDYKTMFQEKIKQLQDKNQTIEALNAFFKGSGFTPIEPELITRTTSFITSNPSVSEDKLIQLQLRDGYSYVLRPDITTSILESYLPLMDKNDQLQVCYQASSYRQTETGLKTFPQYGYEVVGHVNIQDQLKMLLHISKKLKKDMVFVVSYPSFITSRISTLHPKIKEALSLQSTTSLETLLESLDPNDKWGSQLLNFQHQLKINYRLMNLKDIPLSNENIEIIEDAVAYKREYNKPGFLHLYYKDNLGNGIPNVETWLSEVFGSLSTF
jgi:ATP phosphoribosyltransferase regulatory subunit HisZ